MTLLKEKIKESEFVEKPLNVRYGWANEQKLTWFFTKSKKIIPIKGSRLLIQISCESSKEDISTKSTFPEIGDIVSDTNGVKLKIKKINWI